MNNQKLFLGIAIFLTVFLLWNQWEAKKIVDADGNVTYKTQITLGGSEQNIDVPTIDIGAKDTGITISLPAANITEQYGFTTVETDLLTVEISHKGGTIQNAYLNAFPIKKGSEEKFQLLNNEAGSHFIAKSGLTSQTKDSANILPTYDSIFSSIKSNYQLSGDTLTVPITWKGESGVEVTKNFHFQKDSHIVEINYSINNNSNQKIYAMSYVELSRQAIDQSNMMMPTFTGGIVYDKTEHTVQKM